MKEILKQSKSSLSLLFYAMLAFLAMMLTACTPTERGAALGGLGGAALGGIIDGGRGAVIGGAGGAVAGALVGRSRERW